MVALVVASCTRVFWNKVARRVVDRRHCHLLCADAGRQFRSYEGHTDRWGGLPLTIMLTTISLVLAFPLALLVALGRRSQLPAIRTFARSMELVRGVPLISVLFMASFMFPLFMPQGLTIDVLIVRWPASRCSPRLHGRGNSWRPAGDTQRPDRNRRIAGPVVLADAVQDHPAAGAGDGGAGIMNNFISLFKDTSLVPSCRCMSRPGSLAWAQFDADWRKYFLEGLPVHRGGLFRLLLRHEPLQPVDRSRSTNQTALTGTTNATTQAQDNIIVFDKVNKWYGNNFHVLRDINLQVKRGERIVICGPSGSSKSTMIRCINRLEEHQEGRLIVDGTELTDDVKAIDRIRKDVGMVFQQFNLFPHLTVLENLTLSPMCVGKVPKKPKKGDGAT